MALIKFSSLVTSASGSTGGTTFARNRYGAYMRNRTKPVNPNSSRQQSVRGALSTLTVRWSQVLSDIQRQAWNDYANSVTVKNKLGEDVYLTGFNHYIRSNSLLVRAGLDPVDAGPTIYELPSPDDTMIVDVNSVTGGKLSISFSTTAGWANEPGGHLFIFAGQPQNPQRNFFNGPWRYAGKADGDASTPPTSPMELDNPFTPGSGNKQWVYNRVIRADGRLSEIYVAIASVI